MDQPRSLLGRLRTLILAFFIFSSALLSGSFMPVRSSAAPVPGFQRMVLLNITTVYPLVDNFSQQGALSFSREISNLAQSHGYNLTIIDSFDKWDSLLRQPPSGITLFSAHWNWMLIPKS